MEKACEIFLAFLQRNGIVAVVILTVLAVRVLLRRYPKKYSYWLWAIVGIRMMFDLTIVSPFSVFNLFRPYSQGTKAAGGILSDINHNMVKNSTAVGTRNLAAAADNNTLSSAAAQTMTTAQMVFAVLCLIWLAGTVLMLFYGIYSYIKCRKLVRTAVILKKSMPIDMRPSQGTDEGEKNHRAASVWECDKIPSPFVLGIFRSRIYIPFRMEPLEQQYILAHECCHIRRYDPFWKMLAFILLAVYWWNPLVWVAYFYMVRDMEMSCDENVIETFGSEIKKDYSESLLAFAMERHPYSFAPIAFGEGDAGKRIKNVLHFKKPRTWAAVIVLVLLVGAAVGCLTNQKPENQISSEKNETNVTGRENGKQKNARLDVDSEAVEADEQTIKDIRAWAQAFCGRDLPTIRKMATEDARKDFENHGISVGGEFGWSSPWPWAENSFSNEAQESPCYKIQAIDSEKQTAEILYYAVDSSPHVWVWKEIIGYAYENDVFQVTREEEISMYEYIASGFEFDAAYPEGINGTLMDYRTNGMGEILNERVVNSTTQTDPLLDPIQAARSLLNLLDHEEKVQLKVISGDPEKDHEVIVQITFAEDGTQRQVKMVRPWGEKGIWVPQNV
ncbi:MAG: M56 family metallopeptidase [Agathobacter sp.]